MADTHSNCFFSRTLKSWRLAGWAILVALTCMIGTSLAGQFGDFTFTDHGHSVSITDYPKRALGAVVIPADINGKPVVSIDGSAFQQCIEITSVFIPATVTQIGEFAFAHCTSLTSINLPENVDTIGSGCFSNCEGLASIAIPASATHLGDGIFSNCDALMSVSIAPALTKIPSRMFQNCHYLSNVNIPSSVRTVGESAFARCSNLVNLPDIEQVTTVEDAAFSQSGVESVTISRSMRNLGPDAFNGCRGLKNLKIESDTVNVGDRAFADCDLLATLELSETSGTIGSHVFSACVALNDLNLPKSWFEKGVSTFSNCYGLTHIEVPKGVTRLGNALFSDCTFLGSATFEGDAPVIGASTFYRSNRFFTVYYHRGASGFTGPTWNGYPTVELAPGIKVREVAGGFLTNGGSPRKIGEAFVGDRAFRDFEISNGGNITLTDLAISKVGPQRAEFVVSRWSRTSLAPGQNGVVRVEFSPTAVGKRSCTLRITSSDSKTNLFELRLLGLGMRLPGPEIGVDTQGEKPLVDGQVWKGFQRLKVGKKSDTKTFSIKNKGDKILKELSLRETGPHRKDFIVSTINRSSLRPGESLSFDVSFKPMEKGPRSATIHLKSNDTDEKSFDIKLRGYGK
ncbi:MAG: leucine-rich repeat protein [Verrucomicrobiota bacterium]